MQIGKIAGIFPKKKKKSLRNVPCANILNSIYLGVVIDLISSNINRVATVREKVLENEKNSRSGKSQGISFSVREI